MWREGRGEGGDSSVLAGPGSAACLHSPARPCAARALRVNALSPAMPSSRTHVSPPALTGAAAACGTTAPPQGASQTFPRTGQTGPPPCPAGMPPRRRRCRCRPPARSARRCGRGRFPGGAWVEVARGGQADARGLVSWSTTSLTHRKTLWRAEATPGPARRPHGSPPPHRKCSAARPMRPIARSAMASLKWARGWSGASSRARVYASAAAAVRSSSFRARAKSSSIWGFRCWAGRGSPGERRTARGFVDAALHSWLEPNAPAHFGGPSRTRARTRRQPRPSAAAPLSRAGGPACAAAARSRAAAARRGVPARQLPRTELCFCGCGGV